MSEWKIVSKGIPIGFFQTQDNAISALEYVKQGIVLPVRL